MQDGEHPRTADRHDGLPGLVEDTRRLIELLVTSEAPADALLAAGRHVREAVAALAPFRSGPNRRSAPAADVRDPARLMPFDCIVGPLNPLAPPLGVRWEPPLAVAEIAFTAPYEGPPGCVHGGVIAAAFDQVFNVANLMLGNPGPTASLRLRYRRPTPLGRLLRFEGWQERVEERRVHARGRLLAGDQVTVEAEGAFAVVPIERILAMLGRDGDGSNG